MIFAHASDAPRDGSPPHSFCLQVDLHVDDTFQLRHTGDSTVYVTGTYSNDDDSANDVRPPVCLQCPLPLPSRQREVGVC